MPTSHPRETASTAWLIPRVAERSAEAISIAGRTAVGRDGSNEIRLDDRQISRRHALIVEDPAGTYVLSDLGSVNGTYVNERRLVAPVRLRTGDVLGFGALRFAFRQRAVPSEPAPDEGGQTTADGAEGPQPLLIGSSPAMERLFRLITQAGSSDIAVLVQGETGSGKELVAEGVHACSARAARPFQAVNCAAIPEALIESELFGHRRGAFTGATHERAGIIEVADGGTVFLDEIGEMPLAMQPKLLRVLQSGHIHRIGESTPRRVDVRVVAATNRDLGADVAAGRFREDLYYRISAFPIAVPPLREHAEDIPALCDFFLAFFAREQKKRRHPLSPEALAALERFTWPGNVRELRNEIQRLVTIVDGGRAIELAHLSAKILSPREPAAGVAASPGKGELRPRALRSAREDFERQHIEDVMEREGQVVARAAAVLGMSRQGLYKKLREHGLR